MNIFSINRKDAIAMQTLATKDTSRTAISGVRFEMSGQELILIATNGAQMGILNAGRIESSETFAFTANVSMLRVLRAQKDSDVVTVQVHDKEVWFSNKSGKISCELIDLDYPNWKQVLPKTDFVVTDCPAVNVEYLCAFRDIAKLLSKSLGIVARMHSNEGLGVISIFIGDERFYGLQMPLKQERQYKIPEWIKPTQ